MPTLPADARKITAPELRKVAESADGRRAQDLTLYYAVPNGQPTTTDGQYVMLNGTEVSDWSVAHRLYTVVPAHTERILPSGHANEDKTLVKFTFLGGSEQTLNPGKYDTFVWTESAVEKFLFPYYIRHLPKELFDLLYSLYMKGTDENGNPLPSGKEVMALVHLPTSDYDDESRGLLGALSENVIAELYSIGIVTADAGVKPFPRFVLDAFGADAFPEL